jgi:hypothetical protein
MASTVDRVPANTSVAANRAIQATLQRNVAYFNEHPDEIATRMVELDREWDVERALATGSSCLSLVGLTLGLSRRRRWFALPLAVQAFYLQHTLQGWCPPLPLLRALGFRTPAEIEEERCALQMILHDAPESQQRPTPRHLSAVGRAADSSPSR